MPAATRRSRLPARRSSPAGRIRESRRGFSAGKQRGTEARVILAGDVGGTKILLEAGDFRSERWEPVLARRYMLAEYENIERVIEAFLEELEIGPRPTPGRQSPRRRPGPKSITAAAIGAAGMVEGNRVKMTHRAWIVDGDKIARRFDLRSARVVNDLAAAAHGLDVLQ